MIIPTDKLTLEVTDWRVRLPYLRSLDFTLTLDQKKTQPAYFCTNSLSPP